MRAERDVWRGIMGLHFGGDVFGDEEDEDEGLGMRFEEFGERERIEGEVAYEADEESMVGDVGDAFG